jgi:putative radical SAM enzyme (TIGR03279 family)
MTLSPMSMSRPSCAEGVRVAAIRRGSAAAAAGLRPGDRLLTINGTALRDAIDFQFSAVEDVLAITLERGSEVLGIRLERDITLEQDGTSASVSVRRRRGADLGVELEAPRPAEIATCANKCVFCFIHQLPKGMRRSLYVKDDDYRLSFLHGNYITLTDLEEPALRRIVEQRLSPLYVSVHATDPELRHRLLGRPRISRPIVPVMERLATAGIRMHAQIVLCPDLNDGEQLERTVSELSRLHPAVITTAIVPVGLTRHRERLPALRALRADEAGPLVETVTGWQDEFRTRLASRFVFLGDEIYLLAGREPPPAAAYEGFAIAEDGVGLLRRFEDSFARQMRRLPDGVMAPRPVTVVTGQMFAPRLKALLARLGVGGTIDVAAVPNDFFGRSITVAGLLTAQDILRYLSQRALGTVILVPSVMLRDGDGVFLDDRTPDDLQRDLGVPVRVVPPTAAALVRGVLTAGARSDW